MRRSLFLLLVCACARTAPELVGTWTAAGSFGGDNLHGWNATYVFKSNGTFRMTGYPPIDVKGDWKLLERAPGKLRVKLYHQKMTAPGQGTSDWADTEGWGELSADGKSFTYDGKQLQKQ